MSQILSNVIILNIFSASVTLYYINLKSKHYTFTNVRSSFIITWTTSYKWSKHHTILYWFKM